MSDYRDLIYKDSLKILESFEKRRKNQEKLDEEMRLNTKDKDNKNINH